jgi:hypothetical protein
MDEKPEFWTEELEAALDAEAELYGTLYGLDPARVRRVLQMTVKINSLLQMGSSIDL